MDKTEFKKLLDKYINGTVNEEELLLIQQWYDSFGETEDNIPELADESLAQSLQDELAARIFPQNKTRKLWTSIRWAAAVLIIILGAALMYNHYGWNTKQPTTTLAHINFQEIKTGNVEIKKITLKDGSIVHLNSNSRLSIPADFAKNKRQIILNEGEAFFEVAKDQIHPFFVKTTAINIHVLGTAFNVKAYSNNKKVSVAVSHGKVQVENDQNTTLGILTKNEGIEYNELTGQSSRLTIDAAHINSWIEGKVYLVKASFSELALMMHHLYGVELSSKDEAIHDHSYNLTLRRNQPLEEILEIICRLHNSKYRRNKYEIEMYH